MVIGLLLPIALTLGLSAPAAAADFPPGDHGYHTYEEMVAVLEQAVADHPAIVRRSSIGDSWHGRPIWMAKVSDNVGVNEDEPEVLLDGLHHGNEHMTVEMTLSILALLTEGYGTNERITRLVDTREIFIIFMVNPDGGTYDIKGETYHDWRKNRQPNGPGEPIGTDPNRNYPYRWGCCGGSSGDPGHRLYRGAAPLSAPESRAVHDFVVSRVVDGVQQIRTAITFHTSGRLIMWPYGYTTRDLPSDMTWLDMRTLKAMGKAMAATNGYRPIQASDLYISSGRSADWMYGRYRIFIFTFELTTQRQPPDETIPSETSRNHKAVLYLIERAACPYRAVGSADTHCGPLFDDFEIFRGWETDPDGSDTALAGAWVRGRPEPTNSGGPKQPGDGFSGRAALVTGRKAEGCAACNDVDGGRTSIRSEALRIPAGGATLHFRGYLAHGPDSGPEDHLRVRIVHGGAVDTVFTIAGAATDRDAAWTLRHVDLSAFAGQTVRLQFEAADLGAPSLVEAGVDEVRVTAP